VTKNLSADLERDEGRGTRDGMKWEGKALAEPKRQRVVNSEWWLAISDWWMIFLEGSAPALPKNFSAHRKTRPPVTESWAHREVRPPKRRI